MMNITSLAETAAGATLRLEGRLDSAVLATLRAAAQPHLDASRPLIIDLSALAFADAGGVALLRELEARDVTLLRPGEFLRTLLAAEREAWDEATLARGLRHGDPRAAEAFVRRYGSRMLQVARRIVRSDEEARDVVQEAYLSAFAAIGRFTGASRLSTWLHRIVVNAALMRLRYRRRRPEDAIDDLLPRFDDTGHWADPPGDWHTTTEALVERRQTRTLVRAAIDRLPERYRTVLLLRDIEELDTNETAHALGITVNAVKIRLHRARQALRTLLERMAGCGFGTPAGAVA